MKRSVITACLALIVGAQLIAQQSAPQQAKPQTAQPANAQTTNAQPTMQPQAAPTAQTGPAAKKKRSAAKKAGEKTAAQAEPVTPPPPPPAAPPPPAVPQLPPTLMNQQPVSPTVTMRDGLLTIDAPNSTLSDVLNGVRQATGATLEGVSPADRVAVRLGPGSPREVVAALLQGTPYDYLILGSERDPGAVTHILLTQAGSSAEPTPLPQQQPAAVSQPPAPEPPVFFPDQGEVPTGTAIEGDPSQQPPPVPPQQPVNPNQPWLSFPQPPPQPQQQ